MEGRRRRSLPSPSNWAPHSSHQQAQMRRPSAGHAAKRPRTVTDGPLRRARGEVHHAELELGIGETDGLAEIDEVIYLSPRTRQAVALMPEVDWQRELAVVSGLLSKPLPALELEWMPGERLDISALGSAPLVIYCHPGAEPDATAFEPEEEILEADAAECRAFADRCLEFSSMRHRVVGVSSQSARSALSLASQEALPHVLLSDDRLELAEEMGLPTFEVDGVCRYERLTLIVRDGRVEKVFYPVPNPAAHAAEVAQWLREGQD